MVRRYHCFLHWHPAVGYRVCPGSEFHFMQYTAVVTEAKQIQELRAFAGRAYEPESGNQESES